MSDEGQEQQPEIEVSVEIEPAQKAGVWANFARVSHSPYEFTLDFIRIDFSNAAQPQGIVVSRVSVSPLFITQLIEALNSNWTKFAEKSMPRELMEGGNDERSDG